MDRAWVEAVEADAKDATDNAVNWAERAELGIGAGQQAPSEVMAQAATAQAWALIAIAEHIKLFVRMYGEEPAP